MPGENRESFFGAVVAIGEQSCAQRDEDMARVIDQLRSEHGDIARILNVLEAELKNLKITGKPDLDLIHDISDYFLDYPDSCHHPKEDAVYRSLVASRPVSTGSVVDVEDEHETVGKLARDFAETVRDLNQLKYRNLASIVQAGRRFIEVQRHHMKMEEAKLFPMALAALSDDDWASIDAQVRSKTDPVFGSIPEARYQRLRDKIMSGEARGHRKPDWSEAKLSL